jgi:hemolysin D
MLAIPLGEIMDITIEEMRSLTLSEQDWSDHAQELLDAIPQTWTRGLLYVMVGCFALGLPWASVAQIDETGSARGRLEVKGNTVKQEADVTVPVAVVGVHAKEGDTVKAGQVILELDARSLKDELKQLEAKLEGQQNRLAQTNALKNQIVLTIGLQEQQNIAQGQEKLTQVEQSRRNLDALRTTFSLQEVEKLSPIDQAEQALADSFKAQSLANTRLKAAWRELARYQALYKQGAVPEIKVRELESSVQENQRQTLQVDAEIQQNQLRLDEQKRRYGSVMHQAAADVRQGQLRLTEQTNGYESLRQGASLAVARSEQQLKEMATQITSIKAEIIQAQAQIAALKSQLGKYTIRAPISGMVFQFPIKRAGVVVQPKDLLAEIAPENAQLIFRGQIPTADSESIRSGNPHKPVKLKFDEFPFQDYEVIPGKLATVSPDSKVVQATQGAGATVYEIEVELDRHCINAEGRCLPFKAGQPATADIIIRQRRVIDLLLDPFQKLQKGEFKM